MVKKYLTLFSLILLSINLIAQPVNDDCNGLIDLGIVPICPSPDTFTNVDATLSVVFSDPGMNIPSCFSGTGDRDVWFQFTTPADIFDFNITVTGVDGMNNSIVQPQVAVYRGLCALDNLSELACFSAGAGQTELTFDLTGLDANESYFLRINDWSATATPNSGDFILCIKEPDPIYTMGTDTGSGLCSGTLFDSGGPDNNYSNNENATFTICPSVPTNCISLEFINFNLEQGFDNLNFFDGPDVSAPQIVNLTGTNSFPIQAGNNCLTIQFTSDISVTAPGFEILWNCSSTPCETTLIPCLETVPINNLPFISTGITTCNAGNDLNNGPCVSNDPVLEGEDFVYTYQSFNDACLDISIENANINTGLSVYTACPETPGSECLGFDQNPSGDSLSISNLSISAFQTIFIVISNGDGCTDFDIEIDEIPCIDFAAARSSCEDALILNVCDGLPEYFSISQQPNLNSDYFQSGINDGCWSGVGASHYSWLFFQAQTDGEFGMLIENSNSGEATNLNIQVWGPISSYDELCTFMATNQPARSTGALNSISNLTGLSNTNPLDGTTVNDVCEGDSGDGFVSSLPVQNGLFYLILINDFDGNIVNGGMSLDFSPTTSGVLDGLPEDTDLIGQDYTIIGDAAYYTDNFDYSCIQMTADVTGQLSCVWAENQIDFSQPFSNTISIYLGETDANGADGICMVYHNSVMGSNICGIAGEGIGASGIDNSFIIEFDTWQNGNLNDPVEDHIAINVNGDMANPIDGPVTLANIENGQEHSVTFNWDPSNNTYELIFNGVLVLNGTYDIIQNCLQGNPVAFCGYTGSTGGSTNLQYVCTGDNKYPTNTLDSTSLTICEGESVLLEGAEQTTAGFYTDVYMTSTGCDSTIVTQLIISPATSEMATITICQGESVILEGMEQTLPGTFFDTLSNAFGCDSLVQTNLFVIPTFNTINEFTICNGETIFAEGEEQSASGTYEDVFIGISGCDSIVTTILTVIETEALINPPPMVDCTPENNCVSLDANNSTSGDGVTYIWSTDAGEIISDGQTLNPMVCGPGIYTLDISNTVNDVTCSDTEDIEVILNEEIICDDYDFPNAFTPNEDGISDFFELTIIGDRYQVSSVKVFNRWGQLVHESSGIDHRWDGNYENEKAPSDVYFFIFEILDSDLGETITESGDLTLIR